MRGNGKSEQAPNPFASVLLVRAGGLTLGDHGDCPYNLCVRDNLLLSIVFLVVIARSPAGATWQSPQELEITPDSALPVVLLRYVTPVVIARSAVRHDVAIPLGFRG